MVGVEREPGRGHVVAAHHVGDEGLAALAGPLDRPPDLSGREREQRVFRIREGLGAEAAADVRGHDAEVLGLDAQHRARDRVAQQPDALRAGLQRVLALVVLGEPGARLHRVRDQAVVDDPQLDHPGRPGERRIDRAAIAVLPVEREVARDVVVDQRPAGGTRAAGVGHRRQARVVDHDLLGRVLGLGEALCDHEGDRITDVTDPLGAEDRALLVHALGAVAVLHRDHAGQAVADAGRHEVGAGDHREHARRRLRGRDVDGVDPGVGLGRAQHVAVGLARDVDVVGVAPRAGDEPLVLDPPHRLANPELCHGALPPR